MKVQCLNSSAIKTRNLIKKTFAELLNEKESLEKITVTELVKRADITRSTFYTHYANIYEVVQEYKMQTIEIICNDDLKLYTRSDILEYFDNIFTCLKENEETYKLLLTVNDALLFLEKLKKIASNKITDALVNIYPTKDYNLTISFLMNGITIEIIKYYREESNYTLDDLLVNLKDWFQKLVI